MGISSLSTVDVITLKANFEYVYRLRCDQLIDEHLAKGYTKEVAEKTVRGEHGCNKLSDSTMYVIDDIEFRTCPCNFRNRKFTFLSTALSAFDKGILPYPGSLSEQPAKAIEALILLSNMKEQFKQEQEAKQSASKTRK